MWFTREGKTIKPHSTRRDFLISTVATIPAITFGATAAIAADKAGHEENVSPAEDLMREHGALNRILLIYDECARRLQKAQSFDPKILTESAGLIRSFIENYHEKLEEQHLFPRFEKAHKLVDLVSTLRKQHAAGRALTAQILKDAADIKTNNAQLIAALESFNRMYRPHEAREDTILFPAFRQLVSEKEYAELGEQFEDKEHELFGKEGFENNVRKIAALEQQLGIYDLAQFTPHQR